MHQALLTIDRELITYISDIIATDRQCGWVGFPELFWSQSRKQCEQTVYIQDQIPEATDYHVLCMIFALYILSAIFFSLSAGSRF